MLPEKELALLFDEEKDLFSHSILNASQLQ